MTPARRSPLGRGLSTLLGDAPQTGGASAGAVSTGEAPADATSTDANDARPARTLPVAFLHPGAYQPRHATDEAAMDELARSLREKGVLQPLLVRPHPDQSARPGHYEIIAGERRWRAAQKASLHEVPVIIRDFTDAEALEIGLVENLQRQDLSATEEALGYQRLMDEFHHTQEKLADVVGKSRSHVANVLRLLGLPEEVRGLIDSGHLSAGHARALASCTGPLALALAYRVVDEGLSVRQTEHLVKSGSATATSVTSADTGTRPRPARDPDIRALEEDLSGTLGMRVVISGKSGKSGKGTLTVHYTTLDQLDDVIARLRRGLDHRPRRGLEEEDVRGP